MPELSVIIPSRNEEFLSLTIASVLDNSEADTEVIAICDGYWPTPVIQDHPQVTLIHHTTPVGQRRGTNEGVMISRAKYVMKLDAHSAVDKGFDRKLLAACEPDMTMIPRMYNLHAFDWVCPCGWRKYQGPKPERCEQCQQPTVTREIVWKPRPNTRTDFARFDRSLHFQYWREYKSRPQAKPNIADTMCGLGACWFMRRERYLELDGLDENHGFWGQVGVEVACKAWLSGGRHVVNKTTWFAHLFRTQQGFSFQYPNPPEKVQKARDYSKHLWVDGQWRKAKYPLSWIIKKFAPVPDWTDAPEVSNATV